MSSPEFCRTSELARAPQIPTPISGKSRLHAISRNVPHNQLESQIQIWGVPGINFKKLQKIGSIFDLNESGCRNDRCRFESLRQVVLPIQMLTVDLPGISICMFWLQRYAADFGGSCGADVHGQRLWSGPLNPCDICMSVWTSMTQKGGCP